MTNEKHKKYYEFTKGDKAKHGEQILTFSHMDGAFAKWITEDGRLSTGHYLSYSQGKDGIYIPELIS